MEEIQIQDVIAMRGEVGEFFRAHYPLITLLREGKSNLLQVDVDSIPELVVDLLNLYRSLKFGE